MNKDEIIKLLKTVKRDGIEDLINFLENSDFFTAPASTKYHNAFAGGLAQHSLNVYNNLVEITKDKGFDKESLIVCALLHDICKIYFYTVEMATGLKNLIILLKMKCLLGMGKNHAF